MTTKLTLTIDKSTIERAKQFAKSNGRSLSDLVESYLEQVASNEVVSQEILPEDLKKLLGTAKIPVSLNHKKEIRKIFTSGKI